MILNIVLLGGPGSGKGTQAAEISVKYAIPHVSTGDIFREHIREETELGKLAKKYIDQGHLCPDDVTIAMVKERLSRKDCQNGVLLDGFPRTLPQAIALEEFAAVDYAIDLDVDENELARRILGRRTCPKCGGTYNVAFIGDVTACPACGHLLEKREDDTPETVAERIRVYKELTEPLIDFYRKKGILRRVNGNKPIDEIFQDIAEILG